MVCEPIGSVTQVAFFDISCMSAEAGPAYTVLILVICRWGRSIQFLVDWQRCGPEEQSRVPRHHILGKDLVGDFSREHPNKLGKSPGGDH